MALRVHDGIWQVTNFCPLEDNVKKRKGEACHANKNVWMKQKGSFNSIFKFDLEDYFPPAGVTEFDLAPLVADGVMRENVCRDFFKSI